MKFPYVCLLLTLNVLLTGCASGYQAIQPASINYFSKQENHGVELSYKHQVLSKKYAKKEQKKGLKLMAVKITNNSDRDLTVGEHIQFTYGSGYVISPLSQDMVFTTLKQGTVPYLLYLLLAPVNFNKTETVNGVTQTVSSFPIGLILGPIIAGGNMIVAGDANARFKKDLMQYDIMGKVVRKGETQYGLIGLSMNSFETIGIKVELPADLPEAISKP